MQVRPYLLPLFLCSLVATLAGPCLPVHAGSRFLSGFPLLRQQHSLTCEASAASMGTRGRVLEAQLMAAMPRDLNPNVGFRGNPDGEQGTALVDYGVYAAPLQRALQRFHYQSDSLQYSGDSALRGYLDRGWPAVVWITYQLQRSRPRLSWAGGAPFILVPHEHAALAVGYDDHSITLQDPWRAIRVRYAWRDFNRAWGYFGEMALAIQPCPLPDPVMGLRAALGPGSALLSWRPAARAATYKVRVIRHGPIHDRTIYRGQTAATQFAITGLSPEVQYEAQVTAFADCGAAAQTHRLWLQVSQAGPTPTVTEGAVPPPSATTVPTPRQSTPIATPPVQASPEVTARPRSTPSATPRP